MFRMASLATVTLVAPTGRPTEATLSKIELHKTYFELSGNITEAEHLPVAALHFGDTGTPFDDKEGR